MQSKFYPSITTTHPNWKGQIEEVNVLKLSEVCLFPTTLSPEERKDILYPLLEKITTLKTIPFVHLRHDFTTEEVMYFINRWNTKVFNIHCQTHGQFPLEFDLSEFKDLITVEFTVCSIKNDLNRWSGICLDTAHVENPRLKKSPNYDLFMSEILLAPIKVAHISAISKEPTQDQRLLGSGNYDQHTFKALDDFNYLINYKEYLPEICALELENSISDQLEAIKYIKTLLQISNL